MNPQERELVMQLFDRLAGLENKPRDPDAERTIIEGLRRAPNAVYALVQTVLVQDEALKRANARIQELEGAPGKDEPAPTGFLDGMREALLGRPAPARAGSVPSVRPGQSPMGAPAAPWPQGQPQAPMQSAPMASAPMSSGGSFLGTAAAAAAGTIGGAMLLDGIRSMMGPSHGAFGFADPASGASRESNSPWDNAGNSDLGREAGVDDIGKSAQGDDRSGSGFGQFDNDADNNDADQQDDQDAGNYDDDDSGFDDGGGSGGDDFA